MARFYSTFSGSALSPTAGTIAEDTLYQRYTYVAMGGVPATLKSNIISTRDALSTAVLAQLDADNRDGGDGTVIPAFTIGGGNFSWSNVYYNTGAQYNADPSNRPFSIVVPYVGITTGNSTPDDPVDSGSVTDTLYTDAQAAVMAAINAITTNPYARLGNYPRNTLASIFVDNDLTYLAWDDFTPGQPHSLAGTMLQGETPIVAPISATGNITARMSWTPTYISDKNGNAYITARFYSANESILLNSGLPLNLGQNVLSYDWVINTTQFNIDYPTEDFNIEFTVYYRDFAISTSFGAVSTEYDAFAVTFNPPATTTTTIEGTTTSTTTTSTTTTTTAASYDPIGTWGTAEGTSAGDGCPPNSPINSVDLFIVSGQTVQNGTTVYFWTGSSYAALNGGGYYWNEIIWVESSNSYKISASGLLSDEYTC